MFRLQYLHSDVVSAPHHFRAERVFKWTGSEFRLYIAAIAIYVKLLLTKWRSKKILRNYYQVKQVPFSWLMCKINSPIKTQMIGLGPLIHLWMTNFQKRGKSNPCCRNEWRQTQADKGTPPSLPWWAGGILIGCQTVTKIDIFLSMKFVALKFCMSLLYLNSDGFGGYVTTFCIYLCTESSWDRAAFLHSSSYGFVFQICDQNNADNILIILAIDEWCLHSVEAVSGSHSPPTVNKFGLHQRLGDDLN